MKSQKLLGTSDSRFILALMAMGLKQWKASVFVRQIFGRVKYELRSTMQIKVIQLEYSCLFNTQN